MKKIFPLLFIGIQLLCSYDSSINVNLQTNSAGDLNSSPTVPPTTEIYSAYTNLEEKVTYKNRFKEDKESFTTLATKVRESTKYVDFATRILYTHYLSPDQSIQTTIAETSTYSYSASQYLEIAESRYNGSTLSTSFSSSAYVTFEDIINVGDESTETKSYEFSDTISNKYSSEKTKTYTFSSTSSTVYNFHNANDFGIYVQVEYRQKFIMHFIERTNINDKQHANDRGIHGTDYTYTSSCSIYDNAVLLIPVDSPYYCVSQYADNAQGKRVYLDKTEMNNILYY